MQRSTTELEEGVQSLGHGGTINADICIIGAGSGGLSVAASTVLLGLKVVLIEMLGDPAVLDQGLAQFGAGFSEVIVEDRNQVVIDDLKRVIEQEPQVRSIAILYGAAHMPDMARRLADQLDYQPGDESQDRWLTAIKVDLRNSKLSAADLNAVRATMKQAMRQQLRRR